MVYYIGFELADVISLHIFTKMSLHFCLHRLCFNRHIILL